MGRKARNKLGATALSALAAGSLIGVGAVSSTASAASPVSFTYWTSAWTASEIATLDSQFAAANPGYKANGAYIAQSDEYLPKVIAAVKSGTYPTVLVDQNPSDLPLLEQSGKLLPLNNDLTALTNALYPGIRASLFYRGQQLGMALAEEGDIALFYNKTDFAQAGIKSPPSTWAQLQADAVKLTVPSAKRWGFYVPTGDAEWISYDWEPVLWGDGGTLLNANQSKSAFDSPAGVQALSTWVNLVRSEKAAPTASYQTGGNYDAPSAFVSNAVAMITDGPWLEGDIPKSLDYGVAPYPAGTKGPSTNIGILVTALFNTTTPQDQAGVAFIKFLSSPKEAAYLAETSGGLPSSPAQLSQPLLKQDEAKPWYGVFSGEEKFGQVRPITPAYTAVSTALWTAINAAIAGKQTPSQALAAAAKEADQALASNGG